MKLYVSPASPFARKAVVLLHEAGRLSEVTLQAAGGTPVDTGTMPLAANPLGKIPALERADGPAIYDSRVITRFLDDRFAAGLYPAAPRLWDTLTLEATADGIVEAAILMVYEWRVRPEEKRHEPWVEGQWGKVSRSLDAIEARWLAHLAGPLDMAHVGVGCALSYLDFRHADRGWRDDRPGLAAWYAAFAARPSMQATEPKA
jgi:glutathione S-transferase